MVHFFVKRGKTMQDWKIGMEILNGGLFFFSNTTIVKKIDTIHYFHTTGWTARVYGARHLDFVDDRQTLEDMYREYR